MATYQEYRELGDQWLITYACTISGMPAPTLFIIGHSLEAYCKSAILKKKNTANLLSKPYNHSIESMIQEIKREIGILQDIEFLPNVDKKFMTGGPPILSEELMRDKEYLHYISNQELYWVAKYQKDIKYLGTSGKPMPTQYSIMVMERNPYWISIFKELRNFIMDNSNVSMYMESFLNSKTSPMFAVEYLKWICN